MSSRFGAFEFDPATGELRKNGRPVPLEPQPARALALLVSKADEVVTKEELKHAVWGDGTHVDFDRGLAYCLSQVRAALGDSGENPRFVQTLPRRGYRFLAPVTHPPGPGVSAPAPGATASDSPSPPIPAAARAPRVAAVAIALLVIAAVVIGAGWAVRALAPPTATRATIAVSIFDNETGDASHDRLVAGLSDLVVTRLSALDPSRLAVVGNAAVLRQPRNIRHLEEVAAAVNAQYVVLGQLQRAEPGLRFITHLIRLEDLTHLKANRIQMPTGDVGGLEDAVVAEFERAVTEHVLTESRK